MTSTTLPTAPLGRSGMDITRVGFGAWAIGGGDWAYAWGASDDDDAVAGIRHAVESGINWIDTAAVYGLGHSEEVVGRAIAAYSADDRPYIFTKCGLVWDESDRRKAPRRIGAAASIKREAEASLRRLGVERIDLLQMHWPAADGAEVEEYWQALLDLQKAGTIAAAGLSNHDTAQLARAEALGHVDSLQPPFSAIHRATAADLLPWTVEHETGVIVYSPMQSGLLTGAFTRERVAGLPDDDWRREHPDFTSKLDANLAVAEAMRVVAERHGTTQPAVAVAWTLAFPGVTGAIVGARSPQQVDGWLPAAALTLTDQDLAEIAAAIEASGAGEGPARP